MTTIELGGALFGLVSVWLTARGSILCWPTGIASTLLYVVVFGRARLYGDLVTNAMFTVVSVYGWWRWRRPDAGAPRFASSSARAVIVAACVVAVPASGWLLARAGSALPWWDGVILALSFVAQFLLGRKLVESWLLWIVVDVVSVGVYLSRQLYATSVLYAIFLGLACHGLARWGRLTNPGTRL